MYRLITIGGKSYRADLAGFGTERVTIKDGAVSVSGDAETLVEDAELDVVIYDGKRVYEMLMPEGAVIGEPQYEKGESPLLPDKALKRAEMAEARWKEEVGGVSVQGMVVDTSRESQGLITGAALQATVDPTYSCHWKTESGFVDLTAAMIIAVATAVRQHVQSCFDKEAAKLAEIDAAKTLEELEAISW